MTIENKSMVDDILTKISKEYNLSKETLSSIEYGIKSSSKDFKYYGENSRLLKIIKEKYDKDDFFNFEQDIRIEKRLWYNILVE